jgi:hypothetical protein
MRMQRGGVLEHDALAAGPTDLLPIKPRMRISMRARHGITGVDAGAGFPIREAGRPVAMSALRITLCPGVVRSAPQPSHQALENEIIPSSNLTRTVSGVLGLQPTRTDRGRGRRRRQVESNEHDRLCDHSDHRR